MAASSRAQVLRLYRALLRESQRFGSYNYRTYAIRRIRDAFRENKNITDSEKIEELVNKAKANLEIIHRQVCYFNQVTSGVMPYLAANLTGSSKSIEDTALECIKFLELKGSKY